MKVYLEARRSPSPMPWRRVGMHTRTGEFRWYGTVWARVLRKRKLLVGQVDKKYEPAFRDWCRKQGCEARVRRAESKVEALVRVARAEVGVTEQPLGTNTGPRVNYYRRATTLFATLQRGWPWCCAFVVRMAKDAGIRLPRAAQTASVWAFTDWARSAGRLVTRPPRAGDVVVLLGEGKHIGIVRKVKGAVVHTIEGNTTPDGKYGSQYEGTAVAFKSRTLDDVVHVITLDGL